ncbi:hypothetical protein GCM10009642_19430 [Nocardiopsis metallicus]
MRRAVHVRDGGGDVVTIHGGNLFRPRREPSAGKAQWGLSADRVGQSTRGRPDDIIIRLIMVKHTRVMPRMLPNPAPPAPAFPTGNRSAARYSVAGLRITASPRHRSPDW